MPSIRLLASLAIGALAVLGPSVATATESAADYIEPRIDRGIYERFCRRLLIEDDQRVIKELLYSDYAAALADAIDQAERRADEAGRRTVAAALTGEVRLAPEELRALRLAVLDAYRASWPLVDQLLEGLLLDTQSLIVDEGADLDGAMRELRRTVVLAPRRRAMDRRDYAGEGLDLLLDCAEAEEAELSGIDAETLRSALDGYEAQLDVLLSDGGAERRGAGMNLLMARIRGDVDAALSAERVLLDGWRALYQLNRETVLRIGELVAARKGAAAQRRWIERFENSVFPALHEETVPDRQYAWMRSGGLDEASRASMQQTYDGYVAQRDELRRTAAELMIRARIDHEKAIYPMMDARELTSAAHTKLYQELVRNSGERSTLDAITTDALRALLTERQRDRMDRDVRPSRRW